MMDQPQVKDLAKDMRFEGFLLVRQSEQRAASNGSRYLDMNLGDKSGEINAKLWDGAFAPPPVGSVVKVRAGIIEYNGRLQMRIERLRDAGEEEGVDIRLLTPSAPFVPEDMLRRVYQVIDEMANADIQKILHHVIKEQEEALLYFPAAQRLHHAERSGLLHHVTSMLKTADAILACYPFLNGDLLRAGVILHDLSKIAEMDSDSLGNVKDYTKDGLLIGHLVRGVTSVARAAEITGVTGEIPLLLEHMVLSHHGVAEYGSPRKPMFPEAEALHWIDVFDARMNEMEGIIKRTPSGAFSEKIWSLDRRVYHPLYEEVTGENNGDS